MIWMIAQRQHALLAAGGFLDISLLPEATPVGESCAPRVAAAIAFLEQRWGLGLGKLEAAPDLRRR